MESRLQRATLRWTLAAAILATAAGCGGGGTSSPALPAPDYFDPTRYATGPNAALSAAEERAATSSRQIALPPGTLTYIASAGHLSARDMASGAPEASFFYVAYTLPGADPAARPVTFFYNGGPGSSTVWLHLGSFAPRRLVTGNPATTQTAPFPLVDNAETLLDLTDLVFVDAVGTGYSQAIAPWRNQSFWGVDVDAAVFRDFVLRYLQANQRPASPVYLFGESYGTPRTAVLARLLELAGARVTGLVLQSSVLDYNANGDLGSDISCAGFLPSYGAVGAYYHRLVPAQDDLAAFLVQLRAWTAGTYAPAVQAWLQVGTPPADTLCAQLEAATGLAATNWRTNLNLPADAYRTRLLPGVLIGRYDARVSAPNGSPLARDGDPSDTFIAAPFAEAIARILPGDLGYTTPSSYATVNSDRQFSWDFSHGGRMLPDTLPDLAAALILNPRLKILSLNGHHDLATPFYQTELDLARLGAQPNLAITRYAGGHMTYLDDASRALERADLVTFYRAVPAATAAGLPAAAVVPPPPTEPGAPTPVDLSTRAGRTSLGDPYLPAGLRTVPRHPPAAGADLRAEAEALLRAPFLAAGGTLTREQARAAGLGLVVRHFPGIDRRREGRIRFEDLLAFLAERRGAD